jgi:hypothetical protein
MEQHFCTTQLGKRRDSVLNFEARGTSSYMLMETNSGNAGMVKEFAARNNSSIKFINVQYL